MTNQQKAEHQETLLKAQLYDFGQLLKDKPTFIQYYYKILSHFESQTEAFHFVNLQYYLLHDKYLFTTYNAFRLTIKRNKLSK